MCLPLEAHKHWPTAGLVVEVRRSCSNCHGDPRPPLHSFSPHSEERRLFDSRVPHTHTRPTSYCCGQIPNEYLLRRVVFPFWRVDHRKVQDGDLCVSRDSVCLTGVDASCCTPFGPQEAEINFYTVYSFAQARHSEGSSFFIQSAQSSEPSSML